MRTRLSLLILAFLLACAAGKEPAAASVEEQQTALPLNGNNLVLGPASSTGDEVIFEGSNNLFELVQNNPAYFDGSRDVIVIKGNGNIIRFYHSELLDLNSEEGSLVLMGNGIKYLMYMGEEPLLNRPARSVDTIQMKTVPFIPAPYLPELPEESSSSLIILGLLERIQQGEAEAYYELAEMYNYGLDNTPVSSEKAIELYEYGAVRGDILSIRRLADLWFNGSFDQEANKAKGHFYYRLGAQLRDPYCLEMLKKQ